MGGERNITGLVEKLQQLKESSNSKTVNTIFVFTVFFILWSTKKMYEIFRIIVELPDVREPI